MSPLLKIGTKCSRGGQLETHSRQNHANVERGQGTNMFRDSGERQRAIGLWAATSGVGIALGPIVGGLLLTHFWWGSVFLINVPFAAAGIACAIPLVPDSGTRRPGRPDLAGR